MGVIVRIRISTIDGAYDTGGGSIDQSKSSQSHTRARRSRSQRHLNSKPCVAKRHRLEGLKIQGGYSKY